MRSPDRLTELYRIVEFYHKQVPDLRFMQFFDNFRTWHFKVYGSDGFYVEDKEFIRRYFITFSANMHTNMFELISYIIFYFC